MHPSWLRPQSDPCNLHPRFLPLECNQSKQMAAMMWRHVLPPLGHSQFPIVASHRLAGSKSGRSSLVVRNGNGNCNSSPMFLFSVWGHLRTPRVSKNMNASGRRKSNGKETRKRTWSIRFKRGNAIEIHNEIMFDFYLGLPHFIQMSTTLLAKFPRYRKRSILRELVEVVCNTHFRLSLHATYFYTSSCYRIGFIGVF